MTKTKKTWSDMSYRRLLVDTQIPDWDPQFLAHYDPEKVAVEVKNSGAQAVMVYFQSHVGVCNWPTKTGAQHRVFQGKDMLAETLTALKSHDIPVCAYYSVNFNNWAYLEHPEWRIKPLTKGTMGILPRDRYGLCCMNNKAYRAFVHGQIYELLETHDVDGMFFDMMWWAGVCGCPSCKDRYLKEHNAAIPEVVDWFDPDWCRFQKAREGWITEFIAELRDLVRHKRSNLDVYHNFALGMANWTRGLSFDSAKGHDFLGGDFYGGQGEQLVISRLMINLSAKKPVEFMTTVGANLIEHVGLKEEEELALQNFAAVGASSAFLMIATFDPDGRLNPAVTERVRSVYDSAAPYDPYLGGDPVEDIVVYCSDDSKMNFADNGLPLGEAEATSSPDYPHFQAVSGACRALQSAHMPFGVITRKQLGTLSSYPVIILPNLLRMTQEEVNAFRQYVRNGGRLYASRWTGMTESSGQRHEDFMLSDIFGCHFEEEETGRVTYIKPMDETLIKAIAPQSELSHWRDARQMGGAVRVRLGDGKAMASLNLPYGYPNEGTIGGRDWASIHSSPPWKDMDNPTIVVNTYGKGRVIYSAADVESGLTPKSHDLFLATLRQLYNKPLRFAVTTHPAVWVTAFDQPENKRTTMSFLNYQSQSPVLPIHAVSFEIRPPKGKTFGVARRLPDGELLAVENDDDGTIRGKLSDLHLFQMIAVDWDEEHG